MDLGNLGPIAIVVALLLVVAYFVPAVVAFSRGMSNRGTVLVINLFLGWTVIGWIVALAMAAGSNRPAAHY
ncbi:MULTISPECIES: superinfection immunity protein [unclassified Streptomyces]|uniref:superinfection immunity protein n=1 Tax=unclassified Streptomyces TaxID=2593676 RepID=UPI0033D6EA03